MDEPQPVPASEPSSAPGQLGEFQPHAAPLYRSPWMNGLGRPQQLLELACKVVGAAWGGVGLLSADGDLVEHIPWGLSEDRAAELMRASWKVEVLRYATRHAELTCLPDVARERPVLGAPPGLPPVGPFLAVPLQFRGRCRGALYLCRPSGAEPFRPQDAELVQPICTWLEQGTLFEEAHFQAQLQLLHHVAQAAAGNLDLSRILTATLRELDRHLPLHLCAVWLLEPEAGRTDGEPIPAEEPAAPPTGDSPLCLAAIAQEARERARALGLVQGLSLPLKQTPFLACVREGQALYSDWNGGLLRAGPPDGSPAGARERLVLPAEACCFAVPLRVGDRPLGVLQSLITRQTGFTREHIQLLYLVADLLGPAVSNCQLYGRLRTAYEELRVTQGQLVQAEKMRALGELASGMAHEFNNALCGVLGFLELTLLSKNLDASCRGYLESARVCALDASQTVRRVQDFARRQQDELSVQVLDLNELVRQTVELVRHKWEDLGHARGVPIQVEVRADAVGRVAGSPTELREVLTNLIFNAVDAMPRGGTLTVCTWSTADDAFLAVGDTGVGIPAAVRHRLFEPFFTTKGERGNGLGLSVVFGIVRRHRGEIGVESQVGKGSTFTVRLPLADEGAGRAAEAPAPQPPAAAGVAGLRILVIEDDASVRQFLGKGLATLGHRPVLTANGTDGLAAFGQERFDVVLTDLGLPGLSGEEVARKVTQQSPGTPVIVLTGWADQLRAEKGTIKGVVGVLGKPVALGELATTLAAACPSPN